jgi:glyoxylase-like metal-dependent hydrolase (beta-lactamase superfamily II)
MAEIVTFRDAGLGNSSYLLDLGDGRGLVLDPYRDPGPYLAAAERRGLRLVWTLETHLHADFVSGSRELAAMGARVVAPAKSSTWAARPCGRWQPPGTPPSTSPTSSPTAAGRWGCSPAGRCWSARWPGRT